MPTIRDFKVEKVLGKGTYGTVFRVCRLSDGQKYAMKQVDIKKMSAKERKALVNEVRVLAALDSPYIIRFYEAFIEEDKLHVVTDYAAYGDLLRQLKKHAQRKTAFSERAVWSFFLQLCKGIQYLHSNGILHRDIKAANIFIDAEGCLKIGDFGISKILRPGSMQAHAQIGSPYYVSPEMWKKKPYDTKSDIWAIGCFLYELIALRPPFQAKDMDSLSKKILTGRYDPLPASTSSELQQMVRKLLMLEPRARPTIDEIFELKVVNDHMNLVPTPKHEPRPAPSKPIKEHLDLRNTIGTPRRMGDLCHFLPQETRYAEDLARDEKRRPHRSHRDAHGESRRPRQDRGDASEVKQRTRHKKAAQDNGSSSACRLPAITQSHRGYQQEPMERSWEKQRNPQSHRQQREPERGHHHRSRALGPTAHRRF